MQRNKSAESRHALFLPSGLVFFSDQTIFNIRNESINAAFCKFYSPNQGEFEVQAAKVQRSSEAKQFKFY
jgi:hypothetical protein